MPLQPHQPARSLLTFHAVSPSTPLSVVFASLASALALALTSTALAAQQGTYRLERYTGQPVPVTTPISNGVSCPGGGVMTASTVAGGSIELMDGGVARVRGGSAITCRMDDQSTRTLDVPQDFDGTYRVEQGVVVIRGAQTGSLVLSYDAEAGTLTAPALNSVWRAAGGASEPAEGGESGDAPAEGEIASAEEMPAPEGGYDCTKDPVLTRAPRIAAADTAGIGRRVRAAFPAYRLSTEREIACRYPLLDSTTPSTYIPEFGSGKAWWVKRADLDRDGRRDILTVLTSSADATRDLLVVLFANGRAARVTELEGWGFGAEGGSVFVEMFDKGADQYRWNGRAFKLFEDPDACCE